MSDRKITLQLEITLPDNAAPGTEEALLASLRHPSATKRLMAYSLMLSLATPWPALAELPVGCEGACGGKPTVEFGNVQIPNMVGGVPTGTTLDINQYSDKALLNWKTFNISEGSTVNFNQVSDSAVALNRIHDQAPSQILGNLNANGHVYLLNGSGILFGENAQVNVGSLVATTLDLDDEIFKDSSIFARFGQVDSSRSGDTSLVGLFKGDNSKDNAEIINKGTIIAQNGGNILIAAPTVTNEGKIQTEDGQVVLAGAKDRLYLIPSDSSDLRGFLVEVGGDGGTVTNEEAAEIFAKRGNVTLLASEIHQKGEVKASTDTNWGGSVFLLARDHADNFTIESSKKPLFSPDSSAAEEEGDLANSVTLYENSLTEIELELATSAKAIDSVEQKHSRIDIEGKQIDIRADSDIIAKNGELNLVASEKGVLRNVDVTTKLVTHQLQRPEDALPGHLQDYRVFVDSGANIDLSGSDVQLSVQDHLVNVELYSNELKDSPLQKDGVLRGKSIVVDARAHDGKGTPLADISGALANRQRSLAERTTEGGDVRIWSDGDIVVKDDAVIDISGGVTDYAGGYINTTKLIVDGRIVDVAEARPDIEYDGIRDSRRGISLARYEEGYREGHDAGSVQLAAHALALDGDIKAETHNGIHQKAAEDRAQGGTLTIGFQGNEYFEMASDDSKDFRAPSLHFVDQSSNQNAKLSESFGLTDALSSERDEDLFVLSNRFSDLGIQHYQLTSNGEIVIGERGSENQALASIQLGDSASLKANALQVTVNQGLTTAGGTLDLNASFNEFAANAQLSHYFATPPLLSELLVKEGVSLDVSGIWSNDRKDYVTERRPDNDAIRIDGGSIALTGGRVTLQDRVSLDVGGSAHLDEDGKLRYGKGGKLALEANDNLRGELSLGQDFQFDGTAFKTGGTLSISAPSLVLTDRFADSLTSVNADNANGVLAINSSTLRDHGFATFDFNALSSRDVVLAGLDQAGGFIVDPETIRGDLLIKSDFDGSDLQQSNWVFPLISGSPQLEQVLNPKLAAGRLNLVEIDSQAELDSLVTRGQLSDHDRGAMQIDLALKGKGSAYYDIRVEQGAAIEVDAHADSRFALINEAGGDINIARDIRVQGGDIKMTLDRNPGIAFNLTSALRVQEGSTLDVSGIFERDLSQPNFLVGKTLAGGSIDLASTGFIVLEEGSRLDTSGTVATVDALGQPRPGQTIQKGRVQQASNGGDIRLNSDEGSLLAGSLDLSGGTAARAGGSLSLQTRFFSDTTNLPAPPNQDVVRLVDQVELPGDFSALPIHGVSQIGSEILTDSGARNLSISANQFEMQGGQTLSLPGTLQLEVDKIRVNPAADISTESTSANLQAGYVLLGNLNEPSRLATDPLQDATDGQRLTVAAELIDLSGKLAVENVSDLTLLSQGDIRLRQEANNTSDASNPAGLKMNGDLTLQADRVYAVSNTQYGIEVGGDEHGAGSVSLLGNGTAASILPVLSANTRVDINADSILIDTEVAAPFGELNLNAEGALTLGDNARLRASADGEKVPYGYTLNGREWYYGLPGGNLTDALPVLTSSGVNIPRAAVNLKADTIDMQDGAVIDVSNSGDLVATEFIPGTGGSYDYLAQGSARFAILPTQDAGYAPFDQRISADFNPTMGTQIVLGAGSGVPAGTYTLLPAEYAQLEGAYIVNLEPKLKLQPGRNSALPDGTPVSSAYLLDGMSKQISSDYFAVSVRPGSDANLFSEYRRSEMKDFAPVALARLQQSMTGSVFDAGSIGIDVLSGLNLSGGILGQGDDDSATARDARIDIAAAQLRIVNTPSENTENYVELRADQVNQLAEGGSLLLGGKRSESVVEGRTVTRIDATAQEVVVAANAELHAATLLLSADQSIRLESGARIQSADLPNRNLQAGAVQSFHIADGSALLAVSDQRIGAVTRAEGETGTANIALAEGAELDAASLVLDATGQLTLDGSISSRGGDVMVGAQQIALTNAAQQTASQLSQSVLDNLSDALSLTLRSDEAMRVGSGIDLDAQRLTLESAGLNSELAGGSARISADTLLLKGSNSAAVQPEGMDNSGTLEISAVATKVQGGAFSLFGAESVNFDSGEALVLSKDTHLDFIGQNDVTLAANRIAVNTGSVAQISSTGDLALTQSIHTTTTRTLPQMLGGKLAVDADTLSVDTRIDAHSGVIDLASNHSLTLGEHAQLDASGQDVRIQDFIAHTRGGRVTLDAGADLTLDEAAKIDVSAGGIDSAAGAKEAAGTLELFSRDGVLTLGAELLADAGANAQGGRLRIDTATFGPAASLSHVLNQAQASGFDRQVDIRVRKQDAQIAQDVALTADKIAISADQSMTVAGTLGTGTARAGELALSANYGLTLDSTARLKMNSSEVGGEITLASRGEAGSISLTSGAQVSLGVKDRLTLVAERTENGIQITGNVSNLLSPSNGSVRVLGSDQIELGSTLGNADVTSALTSAQSWMNIETSLKSLLGLDADADALAPRTEIAPELLFTSTQNLNVSATNLDLGSTLFNNESRHGHLGILSAGDLTLTTDISDGFGAGQIISTKTSPLDPYDPSKNASFDFSLVAGADLNSAALMDTHATNAVLTVGTGVHVRTGDGDIDLVSGGNIVLQAQNSVVYTAGQDSGYALDNNNLAVLANPTAYKLKLATPVNGGDLRIQAGGDIRGGRGENDRTQLFVDWLVTQQDKDVEGGSRGGITGPELDSGMWINYANFRQGFAAMGGGDLSMEAGGELTRVSASVPTTIHYDNRSSVIETDENGQPLPIKQRRFGEGNLTIEARGNIASPDILVGDGQGTLFSESSFSIARQVGSQRDDAAANFALMGGQLKAESLQDMNLSLLLDPGLMDYSVVNNNDRLNGRGLFMTTSSDSAFDFRSVAGHLTYAPNPNLLTELASSSLVRFDGSLGMSIPAQLTMHALAGDLLAASDLGQVLLPDDVASIELVAGRNVVSNLSFLPIVTPEHQLPDVTRQFGVLSNLSQVVSTDPRLQTGLFRSPVDRDPSRLIAGNDIKLTKSFTSAEEMQLQAGGTLVLDNAPLTIFHNRLDSSSIVEAGRNITLLQGTAALNSVGPGQLVIAAGGDINLGISNGVTSASGLLAPAYRDLPAADMALLAGVKLEQMNTQTLLAILTENPALNAEQISDFISAVAEASDDEVTRLGDAVTAYYRLPADQRESIQQSFASEQDFQKFVNQALLTDALRGVLDKPAFHDSLFQLLKESDAGKTALTSAVQAFTTLPVPDFAAAQDLLSDSGYDLKTRLKLVDLAFRSLPETTQLALTHSLVSTASDAQRNVLGQTALFGELAASGVLANSQGSTGYDRGFNALASVFDGIDYLGDLKSESSYRGDIDVFFSKIYSLEGGDINLLTPGGSINGGVVQSPNGSAKNASELGVVVQQAGDVNAFMHNSYLVNQSRVFTLEKGGILMWASDGNIDAGKGAKTAVAVPPPTITIDSNGQPVVQVSSAIAGSGIRQFDTQAGQCDAFCEAAIKLGVLEQTTSVNLIAPNGEVNAGDAGIGAAGNINIAAARVVGADNIDVGGVSVGVPVDAGGLNAGLSGLGSVASDATKNAAESATDDTENAAPLGEEALAWLEVFVLGYGDEEEEKERL